MKKDITQFLEYLELTRGLSRATLTNYHFYLNRFADFAKSKNATTIQKITEELVNQYRLSLSRYTLADGECFKKNTQNYHLIALRSFLKYLTKHDRKTLNPEKIELAKQAGRQVDFIEGRDLKDLLDAPSRITNPAIIQKRDKAILETLFSTGLRVSELAKLKIKDVNLNKEEFTVRGKGSKLRLVFLAPRARDCLKDYLETRNDISPFLFVRHDKGASGEKHQNLTPRSIQRLVQKYTMTAGITKQVTPHTLRHSYATDLLINGADIRSVQTLLGHSSITTTQVYTHITDQQLKEVYKAFHDKKR